MKRLFWMILPTIWAGDESVIFHESFDGKLGPGWAWLREDTKAWRIADGRLEIRVEPGNMWGPANDGKNILMRALPSGEGPLILNATVENHPTGQYEQIDLVLYQDDGHMVKIGEEQVDGKVSIVMGREQDDRTQTLAIIPIDWRQVDLRLRIENGNVRGEYRTPAMEDYAKAGECDLPGSGPFKASLQAYQGPEGAEHWARITWFELRGEPNSAK